MSNKLKITVEFDVDLRPEIDADKVREHFLQYLHDMEIIEGDPVGAPSAPFWVRAAKLVPDWNEAADIAFEAICTLSSFEFGTDEYEQGKELGRRLDILSGNPIEEDEDEDEDEDDEL
jgi:hypothetical protein